MRPMIRTATPQDVPVIAQLIRELKDLPDHAVLRLVREVRDGKW